jgi:dTDP-4-amino-4,6-dideoxygalactose transaminase
MEEVQKVAKEYGLFVVEDACQAMFSRNYAGFLGTQSDAGCFSLGVTKLVSTGQGGVVVTRNRETYERLKLIRNHGVEDTFAGTYAQMGFNFKFTDMLASIGLVQLTRVQKRIAHLNAIYEKYTSGIVEFEFPFLNSIPVKVSNGEVPLYAEVLCSERTQLMDFLASQDIQTRPLLPDLHLSPHLKNTGNFPHSKVFSEQGIYLPSGPGQPLENIDRVLKALHIYAAQ